MEDRLRAILEQAGRLAVPVSGLAGDADLFAAGLSSLATVNVMLAIEDEFGVEFPDSLLSRRSFESIAALIGVVATLQGQQAAA